MIDPLTSTKSSPNDSSPRRTLRTRIRHAAKSVLPGALLRELLLYKAYKKEERPIYLRSRLRDTLPLNRRGARRLPEAARSILFLCYGNIMRSPMCEALMKRALVEAPGVRVSVSSAGLNAIPGKPAHPWAIAAAHELGISLESHRARLVTPELVEESDIIFVMDYQNRVHFLARHPNAARKMFMLSNFAGDDYKQVEIQDPYYQGEEGTRHCYKVLRVCIKNLTTRLSEYP